jgi:hypothetical protein
MPREIGTLLTRRANAQKGLVTREELLAAGLTKGQVDWRVQSGLLIPEYDGVYRLGHAAPNLETSYLAAVLACGEGSLLSGRAAAHLYGLVRERPRQPEVTTTSRRRPAGVIVHRKRAIHPRDATEYRGIPVTTVPRTVADAAADTTPADLALLFHEARIRFGLKPEYVEAVLARSRIRDAAKLRRVVWGDERVLLSELERGFVALLERHRLPLPETNIPKDGHWVDCWWPELKLTVELDTYRYHGSRHAWERDVKRERKARKRGDYRRYVWGDVFETPEELIADLSPALAAPSSGRPR